MCRRLVRLFLGSGQFIADVRYESHLITNIIMIFCLYRTLTPELGSYQRSIEDGRTADFWFDGAGFSICVLTKRISSQNGGLDSRLSVSEDGRASSSSGDDDVLPFRSRWTFPTTTTKPPTSRPSSATIIILIIIIIMNIIIIMKNATSCDYDLTWCFTVAT